MPDSLETRLVITTRDTEVPLQVTAEDLATADIKPAAGQKPLRITVEDTLHEKGTPPGVDFKGEGHESLKDGQIFEGKGGDLKQSWGRELLHNKEGYGVDDIKALKVEMGFKDDTPFEVVLALDNSASRFTDYQKGVLRRVANAVVGAITQGMNQESTRVVRFIEKPHEDEEMGRMIEAEWLPSVTLETMKSKYSRHFGPNANIVGHTKFAPLIREVARDTSKEVPRLVVFVTDGELHDVSDTIAALQQLSDDHAPVYVAFIHSDQTQEMHTNMLPDLVRRVALKKRDDKACFHVLPGDITRMSEQELVEGIVNPFLEYVKHSQQEPSGRHKFFEKFGGK